MWEFLEWINDAKDETVDVNKKLLLSFTQQTILLLGQSLNMMFPRRYNASLSIIPYTECKTV